VIFDFLKRFFQKKPANIDTSILPQLSPAEVRTSTDLIQETSHTPQSEETEQNPILDEKTLHIEISDIFNEKGLPGCVRYLHSQGIFYAKDLLDFDFDSLHRVFGFEEKKVKRIKEIWSNFLQKSQSNIQEICMQIDKPPEISQTNYEEEPSEILPLDEKLSKTPLSSIFNEGLLSGCVKHLHEKGLYYAKDLLDFDFKSLYLVRGIGRKKVAKINEIWNNFLQECRYLYGEPSNEDSIQQVDMSESLEPPSKSKIESSFESFDDVFQMEFNTIIDTNHGDVLRLRAYGLTLEDIGEAKGITRERARQIEKQILLKMKSFIERFSDYLDQKFKDRIFITSEDISILFNDDSSATVFAYALENNISQKFQFLKELDIFLIDMNERKVKNNLQDIIENYLPNTFKFDDYKDNINDLLREQGIDFITPDMLKKYLLNIIYKEQGKYISKQKLTLADIAKIIIRQHFPEKIKVNDPEFIRQFKMIAKDEFGFSREKILDRYISTRISDSLLLCGRGIYTLPENVSISKNLLLDIKQYIDDCPENTILFKNIFLKFQHRLAKESNIDNEHFLHGVLKLYFGNEYYFNRDSINKNKSERKNSHEILENYLGSKGKPVSKEDINAELPGFTSIMLSNSVNSNPNILRWDDGYYAHKNVLKINDNDIASLKSIIDRELTTNNNYTNINILYPYVRQECYDFLIRNNIQGPSNLFFVLEYLLRKDYKFSNPHILNQNTYGRFTTANLIYNFIKEKGETNIRELSSYISQLKLNPNTIYSHLEDLRDKIFYLSSEEVMIKENFSISEEKLDAIKEKLNGSMEDKNYLILRKQDLEYFPYIVYSWNFYLLQSIIESYLPEFKLIRESREESFAFIVKKDFPINNCEDMVKHIVDKELNRKMINTSNLEELMREKGIFNKVLYSKIIKSYRPEPREDVL